MVSWLCASLVLGSGAELAVETKQVDVVVVGAGQAGMAAAARLAKQGHSVQVLEASSWIGGRTRNFDVTSGVEDTATDDVIELGGTWLSPLHSAVIDLCQEFGLEVFNGSFVDPQDPPEAAEDSDYEWWYWGLDYPADQRARVKSMVLHTQNGTFRYRKPSELLASFDATSMRDLRLAGAEIDKVVATIDDRCWEVEKVGDSWADIDLHTTGSKLQPLLSTLEARSVLRNSIHDHNAAEPESVGFLYNSMSFKGCNSDGPGGQYRVRNGTQGLPLAIAASLGPERVSLRSPVRSIKASGGTVRAVTAEGLAIEAKAAVVTGSPPAVLGIDFSPPLGATDAQLLQRMPMGTSYKFAAIYEGGPWWRDLGFQGDIIATALPEELSMPGSTPEARRPLFGNCVDHSPFSRKFGVICCFVEGRQNLYLSTLPPKHQQDLLLRFLELSFNSSRARKPRPRFVGLDWKYASFVRGAYTAFLSPGMQSVPEYWAAFRTQEKAPGVFLAGADYHTGYGNGYIEGAVRSGQRAADAIDARLRSTMADAIV